MNIDWFFLGWTQLATEEDEAASVLELCMRYGLVYRHWRRDPNTARISFEMTSHAAEILCRRCREEGIVLCVLRHVGLPHLIHRYRYRVGILLGTMLGLGILLSSSRVLWDIRISGNEAMTLRQVRAELAASGLRVGMPLSELDPNRMEMQIQLDSERISWISINMSGTVAHVELRERVAVPERAPLQPANLVARHEGIVEGLEVFAGNTVVQIGQAVQAGDLLVSGLYDSQAIGWRVTRAAGRVLARTVHEFSVEIPLTYEKKVYAGASMCQKTLIFFEKEIKLFKNSSILGASCDKINYIDTLVMKNGTGLPFCIRTERYFPYEYQQAIRTPAQAEALAYYEMERQIEQALPGVALLRKNIAVTLTDESYFLCCTVQCLEDIAEVREFTVVEER